MANLNYESIDKDSKEVDELSSLMTTEPTFKSSPGHKSNNTAMFLAVGFLVVVAIAAWNGNFSAQGQESALNQLNIPLWGRPKVRTTSDIADSDATDDASDSGSDLPSKHSSTSVRECTFLECWEGQCSWADAPYICLSHNDTPNLACSKQPWVKGTCDVQCDLSNCLTVEIPKSVDSCKHKQCSDETCCGVHKCSSDLPYQCMKGAAQYGCHADPFKWDIKVNDDTCSQCCDFTTCPQDTSICDDILDKAAAAGADAGTTDDQKMEASGVANMHSVTTVYSFLGLAVAIFAMMW